MGVLTEGSYCDWAGCFIAFSRVQNEGGLFENVDSKVVVFLTDLVGIVICK